MIQVLLNGTVLQREFKTKQIAKDYIAACKRIDKKYGEKSTYKIVERKC